MSAYNQGARTRTGRPTRTFEGGKAVTPSPLQDLMFTTVCTYAGQDTFYETATDRDQRIADLVRVTSRHDPRAVVDFIGRLRNDFNIRTAAILVAAEFVAAGRENGNPQYVREAVSNACVRADEPAELLAYWMSRHGRSIPRGMKLGIGDAVRRLYNPWSVLKWDSTDRSVRMADVIELCHVEPETEAQSTLYRWLLDRRHRGKDAWGIHNVYARSSVGSGETPFGFNPDHLQMFVERQRLQNIDPDLRRSMICNYSSNELLRPAGVTWEFLSSWLPGGMDAEAWEYAIPQMNVMALIRNLRNFDQVGISEDAIDDVIRKITSEEDVRKSRIFPYRVYAAYQEIASDNWQRALGKTLELASGNLPRLDRSLLLIDTSGSMRAPLSHRSAITRVEVAALQATSVAAHSKSCDIVMFAQKSARFVPLPGSSILGLTRDICSLVGAVGHSTLGHAAILQHFDPAFHDRVMLFTDDQMQDSGYVDISHVPQVVTFNVGGYAAKSTWGRKGGQLNLQVAGFSDQVFTAVVEALKDTG